MFDVMKNSRIYKFLRKIAGDDIEITPSNTLEECLDDIADVVSSGSGLPEVTSADNGKTLIVKNAAWAIDNPAGSPFVVDISDDAVYPNINTAIGAALQAFMTKAVTAIATSQLNSACAVGTASNVTEAQDIISLVQQRIYLKTIYIESAFGLYIVSGISSNNIQFMANGYQNVNGTYYAYNISVLVNTSGYVYIIGTVMKRDS